MPLGKSTATEILYTLNVRYTIKGNREALLASISSFIDEQQAHGEVTFFSIDFNNPKDSK